MTLFGIIDRYILRETLKAFLAILSVMTLILISHAIMKLLQRVAAGRFSAEILMQLIALESATVLGLLIPPAFFFAILYSLGRMYRDSEMTALFSGGIGIGRIYRSYLLLALPLTALVATFTLLITPEVNRQKELLKEHNREFADLTYLPAGRFHEARGGELTYFFERLSDDGQRLEGIFIRQQQADQFALITASSGHQASDPVTGERFIILEQGRRYAGIPGESGFSSGQFERYGLRLEAPPSALTETLPYRAAATRDLFGRDEIRDQAELQGRFMLPLAILVFTLISIPLSRSLPREGIYGRLVLAVLFYFLFVNLMALSEDWMRSGATPLWMGRWWVHPFMLLIAATLLQLYTRPPLRLLHRLRRA